ncbi:MAG TPA: ABC transporter substrate-binding protein, partial [Dehalococcoidia bacterium]|nr:ABC transporter substrate-binding protein [Dehalococcoidia bacterium]
MHRRLIDPRLFLSVGLVALTACSSQPTPPPTAPTAGTQTGAAATTTAQAAPTTVPLATAPATEAASPPASAPAASPVAVEPSGKVVYAFHAELSPAWLDPQENPQLLTPYATQLAIHDAMVKALPGRPFAPSLAESYEIAPDFTRATFTIRANAKFHNGDPVTSEDVKFTFENYRGTNAKTLHDMTDRIETPDARTVTFVFKKPFLDFLVLYGSMATGAGWIVPKAYYQQVGPDGFKRAPIGAGPYKFVSFANGELTLEAMPDYWRKTPAVKTLVIRGVAEEATRVAQLQTNEADLITLVPGTLVESVRQNPQLTFVALKDGSQWLEFPGYEKPENPFNKKEVRQAVDLILDRQAINEAETAGLSPLTSNWIPDDWPGAIITPPQEYNPAKAKQLMAQAGYPDGFDAGHITPLPPFFSLAERVSTGMRQLGIRTTLQQMDRGAFITKLGQGPGAFQGVLLQAVGSPGDAASRIQAFATCQGVNSRTCDPYIDETYQKYQASIDPQEREKLIGDIQRYMIDNYIFLNIYRVAFLVAHG